MARTVPSDQGGTVESGFSCQQPAPGVWLPYLLQEVVQQPRSVPLQVKCGVMGQRHDSSAERAALPLRQEGVLAGGLGAAAAQGLQQRRADPRQRLSGDTEVNAGNRRGSHAPQRVRGDPRAVPGQGSLTSALPQTQPDASVQAWEPTLSAPDPWKRRRPSREARKAVRSSSRVNVCG